MQAETVQGYKYMTMSGDTFDSISLDFYDDERFASVIIQANLKYRKVITFSGGEKLFIPIIDDPAPTTLPPWKRGD
ncbi:hypothetical protein [Paenibacillus antibioticophila]|uniref:hypothetical protein n=1 Tax=Paenibacillus antibioticophila TaxID=1274374 RepID=UPI0005CA36EC|nr:hypothetical protein [Paenibacillus antibioticophila]